jgi:RNA polymerase sigma-70 factor (ECF subfamily)
MFVETAGAVMEELGPAPSDSVPADPVEAVVLRILEGDEAAFEELVALTQARVLGAAWRLLGDREQARDAAQEVFLRIFRSLATYRPGENFQAWMYRITANVCFDHLRKRGPVPVPSEALEELPQDPQGTGAEDAVLLNQRRALLQRALGTLTPAERSALVLRDLEGLSTDEVAQALGVRPVTVRSQISNARTKLQAFCARLLRNQPGGLP